MITHEKRDKIKAAAKKATTGPWELCGGIIYSITKERILDRIKGYCTGDNANFIALTDPDTAIEMLDALDAKEAALSANTESFRQYAKASEAENTRLRKALIQHRGDLHCGSGRPCGTCKQSAEALGIDVPDRCAQGHIDNKALTPKKN